MQVPEWQTRVQPGLPPAKRQNVAEMTQFARSISVYGKAITDYGKMYLDRLIQAKKTTEVNTALRQAREQYGEFTKKILHDPKTREIYAANPEKYQTEHDEFRRQLTDELMQGLTIPESREEFTNRFNPFADERDDSLQVGVWGNSREFMGKELGNDIKQIVTDRDIDALNIRVGEAWRDGVITEPDAQDMLSKGMKDIQMGMAEDEARGMGLEDGYQWVVTDDAKAKHGMTHSEALGLANKLQNEYYITRAKQREAMESLRQDSLTKALQEIDNNILTDANQLYDTGMYPGLQAGDIKLYTDRIAIKANNEAERKLKEDKAMYDGKLDDTLMVMERKLLYGTLTSGDVAWFTQTFPGEPDKASYLREQWEQLTKNGGGKGKSPFEITTNEFKGLFLETFYREDITVPELQELRETIFNNRGPDPDNPKNPRISDDDWEDYIEAIDKKIEKMSKDGPADPIYTSGVTVIKEVFEQDLKDNKDDPVKYGELLVQQEKALNMFNRDWEGVKDPVDFAKTITRQPQERKAVQRITEFVEFAEGFARRIPGLGGLMSEKPIVEPYEQFLQEQTTKYYDEYMRENAIPAEVSVPPAGVPSITEQRRGATKPTYMKDDTGRDLVEVWQDNSTGQAYWMKKTTSGEWVRIRPVSDDELQRLRAK